jgi:hypothetical protein
MPRKLKRTSGVFETADSLKPYKVYIALLNQAGTAAPVATVLQNELGGGIVWTRDAVGSYVATLGGAFPSGKTAVFVSNFGLLNGDTNIVFGMANDTNMFNIFSSVDASLADDVLFATPIEIRVYP